jgi:hypothetical protein
MTGLALAHRTNRSLQFFTRQAKRHFLLIRVRRCVESEREAAASLRRTPATLNLPNHRQFVVADTLSHCFLRKTIDS